MTEAIDPEIISEKLCAFIRESLVAHTAEFNEHSRLSEFGLDSFSLVELLLFCERSFGVIVPESHLTHENLESVATLSLCVSRLARPEEPGTIESHS